MKITIVWNPLGSSMPTNWRNYSRPCHFAGQWLEDRSRQGGYLPKDWRVVWYCWV